MSASIWHPPPQQRSAGSKRGLVLECETCKYLATQARYDLLKLLHQKAPNGKLYDVSAVTSCKVCRGVVVISLTDEHRKVLPYKEMVRWFYDLHMTQMQCVGSNDHVEAQGWGYYWNLDQVLAEIHPKQFAEDMDYRGGRRHFGIEIGGKTPGVHLVRTNEPLSRKALRTRRNTNVRIGPQ